MRLDVTKWIKSCLLPCFGTFKISILMFISILVFRPEDQIWNPVRRDTRIYVRRILKSSLGSKPEILSRIAQTTAVLSRLKIIWRNKYISLGSKAKLVRTLILSTFFMLVRAGL